MLLDYSSLITKSAATKKNSRDFNHAQVQGEQYLFALVLHAIRTRIEGSGRRLCGGGFRTTNGGVGGAWAAGLGGGPPGCPDCGGAADPGCPMCEGTGVSLSELGFMEDDEKKAKTKSKKKRERKARAKAVKRTQDETAGAGAATAAAGSPPAGRECKGHGGANHNNHRANAKTFNGSRQRQQPRTGVDSAGGNKGPQAVSAARAAAGSSQMESAGSLLSMLDGPNERGGDGGPSDGDGDGDEGIDEDLVREMERLRIQKARADVQRTRAALRSNLQKNFDQLLVSSSAITREAGGGKV